MSRRVTVKDLREEARNRLKECRGGKQMSKMNKTQLLQFLECIDDIELAREYREQEAARLAKRSKRVDDEVTINPGRKRRKAAAPRPPNASEAAAGAAAARARAGQTGAGHMPYRQFVQQNLPKYRARGMSNQDAMRAVAQEWRAHKQKGGGKVSDIANTIATGTAIAGAVQPELAPILEPAAAIAKGVGWVADLF